MKPSGMNLGESRGEETRKDGGGRGGANRGAVYSHRQ